MAKTVEPPAREEPERSRGSGVEWFYFWIVLLTPMAAGLLGELLCQFDVTYRVSLGLALCLLLIVVTCSFYCAAWIVTRMFEQTTLRVFIGSSLVLFLSAVYLLLMLGLHYLSS